MKRYKRPNTKDTIILNFTACLDLQLLDLTTSNCHKMTFLDKSDLSESGQNAF